MQKRLKYIKKTLANMNCLINNSKAGAMLLGVLFTGEHVLAEYQQQPYMNGKVQQSAAINGASFNSNFNGIDQNQQILVQHPQQLPMMPQAMPASPENTVNTPKTLNAQIEDFPQTFTFRNKCIQQTYSDKNYGTLYEPYLVKENNGTYTLHATCSNNLGTPNVDSSINLILAVRNLDQRYISIRSTVNGAVRNCRDITANADGKLICIPYEKLPPQ